MTKPQPSAALVREAEYAYHRLACLYARAMDSHLPELLDQILSGDVVIAGPAFTLEGLQNARQTPAQLREMFLKTQHLVHNQTLTLVDETRAEGETYCTASHILRPAAGTAQHAALVWAIRYQDELRREAGEWRLARRALIVDWSETRPIALDTRG